MNIKLYSLCHSKLTKNNNVLKISQYLMKEFHNTCYLIWRSNNIQLSVPNIYKYLPSKLSLLFLSDGSLTKIIESVMGVTAHIQLTNDTIIQNEYLYYNFIHFKMYRQGWLINQSGMKLLFMSSWYKLGIMEDSQVTPIGKLFIDSELEFHRRLCHISCFSSTWFEKQFNFQGYIWSREYILYYRKSPFILIREFLSPKLANKDYLRHIY